MPFIAKKSAYPPLGLLTVAAFFPRSWHCKLIDLNVSRLTDDDIAWADFVLISGMLVQAESSHDIAHRCKHLGTPVIAGGPLFTTGYEQFPEIDHVVLGEAETIMPTLIRDMSSGNLQNFYRGTHKTDITHSPVPRWDLINFRDYATMAVQFSRGCPFNCEFCDIIVMYGRTPRLKTAPQLINELDALLNAGWKGDLFIVDDNFIGHPRKAKELLHELIAWRKRRRVHSALSLEASLNLVDDLDMLNLMAEAGVKRVFVGIETPQPESLVECNKVQNTQRDMMHAVRTIQRAGIEVMGGFILGFDQDKLDIFEQQWRFIQKTGIATAMVGLLTALPKTQLYIRLKEEGRLLAESTGNNLDAILNFIPRMDRERLINGYRALVKRLYSPKAYYCRALTFLRNSSRPTMKTHLGFEEITAFIKSLWVIGFLSKGRRQFWKYLAKVMLFHPRSFHEAVRLAIVGYHFRRVAAKI